MLPVYKCQSHLHLNVVSAGFQESMRAAQNTAKGRYCQACPKHERDSDAGDPKSHSLWSEKVLARAKDKDRRFLKRTTSWRYHPRPRGLARRPQQPGEKNNAVVAVSAAAAAPPSWLKPSNGPGLLLLVCRGGGGSGGNCGATRLRSVSDSTALLWSSWDSWPCPSRMVSRAREAHQEHGAQQEQGRWHRENSYHLEHEPRQGPAQGVSAAELTLYEHEKRSCQAGGDEEKVFDEAEEWYGGRSATVCWGAQPGAASSIPTEAKSEKGMRVLVSWLGLGLRRRARLEEENPLVYDSQDPAISPPLSPPSPAISPPLSPSSAATAPLLSPPAKRSRFGSAFRSLFRRRRRPSKPSRRRMGGKVIAAATLACSAAYTPMQGKQRPGLAPAGEEEV